MLHTHIYIYIYIHIHIKNPPPKKSDVIDNKKEKHLNVSTVSTSIGPCVQLSPAPSHFGLPALGTELSAPAPRSIGPHDFPYGPIIPSRIPRNSEILDFMIFHDIDG